MSPFYYDDVSITVPGLASGILATFFYNRYQLSIFFFWTLPLSLLPLPLQLLLFVLLLTSSLFWIALFAYDDDLSFAFLCSFKSNWNFLRRFLYCCCSYNSLRPHRNNKENLFQFYGFARARIFLPQKTIYSLMMSLLQYSIAKLYKNFLCESLRTMSKTSFYLFDHRRRKPSKKRICVANRLCTLGVATCQYEIRRRKTKQNFLN